MRTDEWVAAYRTRLIERGIDASTADFLAEGERAEIESGACDCATYCPIDAADDEISYMKEST